MKSFMIFTTIIFMTSGFAGCSAINAKKGPAAVETVESQGGEFEGLISDVFEISVSGGGESGFVNSVVYKTKYNMSIDDPIFDYLRKDDTASFTDFASDFKSDVRVRVKMLAGEINTVTIRPLNFGVEYERIDNETIEITLGKPMKISVEINETKAKMITDKLFIFASALDKNAPETSDESVCVISPGTAWDLNNRRDVGVNLSDPRVKTIYFEKGLHFIEEDTYIPGGKSIYFAPGSYVYGSFNCLDPEWRVFADDVTIRGRGILDSFYGFASQILLFGKNCYVEDVVLLHKYKGPRTPVIIRDIAVSAIKLFDAGTVKNVKVINWMHAGGIFGQNGKFTVDDCFIFTNDDCIDISYPRESIVTNNTTWNYYNGSAICMTWGSVSEKHKALVDNLNVIHWDSRYDDPGCFCGDLRDDRTGAKMAVFFASHDSPVPLGSFTIKNVRIESMHSSSLKRLFSICVFDNQYTEQDGEAYHDREAFGGLHNILFENIAFDGDTITFGNAFYGYGENAKVSDVTFKNLTVKGKKITSLDEMFAVTNEFVEKIMFK
ncbi:MAG: hypothetical protein FWF03_03835 [Defluviitaleaceae bacterium]|nr:hypothetical protein [Defluviitaleaceae bacterium]